MLRFCGSQSFKFDAILKVKQSDGKFLFPLKSRPRFIDIA